MTPDHYNTIEKSSAAEFKDKGSRFIAFAFPISDANDFKEKLQNIKKQHPKATHHCFAYRLGPERNIYRVSDDGEPSGTAGKPILGQIDSNQLTNVLIIVVRYFGGTLLGVGGLINAYKTSAALALQLAQPVQKPVLLRYRLELNYTLINDVMIIARQFDCVISQREIGLYCSIVLDVPKSKEEKVLLKLDSLNSLEFTKI